MIPRKVTVALDGSSFAERANTGRASGCASARRIHGVPRSEVGRRPRGRGAYLTRTADDHGTSDAELRTRPRGRRTPSYLAEEDPAAIVCMTSHGREVLRWSVLGSVAEDVIRESRPPHNGAHGRPPLRAAGIRSLRERRRCLDGAIGTDAVEPLAIDWATSLNLVVHAVQVIHPLDVEWAEHPNEAVQASVSRMQAHGLDAHHVLLRSRLPAHAIADYVATVANPIVMMSSHSRTGMARVASEAWRWASFRCRPRRSSSPIPPGPAAVRTADRRAAARRRGRPPCG